MSAVKVPKVTLPDGVIPADLKLGYGYRLLKAGEELQHGDDYWWQGEWHEVIMEHLTENGLWTIDLWARRKI